MVFAKEPEAKDYAASKDILDRAFIRLNNGDHYPIKLLSDNLN